VPTLDEDGGDEKERVFQAGEAKLRHTLFAVEGKDGLVGPGVGVEQVGPDIERILASQEQRILLLNCYRCKTERNL